MKQNIRRSFKRRRSRTKKRRRRNVCAVITWGKVMRLFFFLFCLLYIQYAMSIYCKQFIMLSIKILPYFFFLLLSSVKIKTTYGSYRLTSHCTTLFLISKKTSTCTNYIITIRHEIGMKVCCTNKIFRFIFA